MGLLQKLKSVLGIDGRRGHASPSDPDVTVEREPSAESERAVKQGGSAGASASGTADDTPRAPRSANNVGSERASDASATEEGGTRETATEETTTEGTATEETGDVTDDATGDAADDATTGAASDDAEASEPSRASGLSETPSATVDEINGIGPTYADRLTAAGIETVADLADADAQTVADAAETSPARAEDWLEQARDF